MTKHELLSALRAATEPSRELDKEIWLAFTPGATRKTVTVTSSTGAWEPYEIDETREASGLFVVVSDYTSSLDAAVSFCERMLPGWHWEVCKNAAAMVRNPANKTASADYCEWGGKGEPPALALCAAVIVALIAQEEQND